MSRTQSADLTETFKSYSRRDWLDLYLSNDTPLHLSHGKVVRGGTTYDNWIASVEEMDSSIDTAVDRITISCQNVNSLLGFNVASNLRLLDYAVAVYGKIYQSTRNPALVADLDMFRCVLGNATAAEERITFELIADYDSLGSVVAAQNLSPRCWLTFKNGIECTSTSDFLTCPKTRAACAARGKPWEFGGWEFFEEPTSDVPGAGGNQAGGLGEPIVPVPCFILDTPIWTPRGDIAIGDFPLGELREPIKNYSFDERTGEIAEDEIWHVSEHEVTGYFNFDFQHGGFGVTKEHPIFVALRQFRAADDFKRLDTAKAFINQWFDSKLVKIKWNSDARVLVRNLSVRKNKTYFANRVGVHNKPYDPYQN